MMLHTLAVDCHPRMLAFLPYRVMSCREVLVGKRANGNGEQFAMRTGVIPKRRPAGRAKMEIGFVAAVADMLVEFVFAAKRHRIRRKPRLRGKDRPAAFLAVIAMANRNADRFASASDGKLAAAAGGSAVACHFPPIPNPSP